MIDIAPPDYEGGFRRARRDNAIEVRKALDKNERWIIDKIVKHADDYGFDRNETLTLARNHNEFLFKFAKEPGRQSFHENTFYKYLCDQANRHAEGISPLRQLPRSGPDSISLSADGVVGVGRRGFGASKTIDFTWTLKTRSGIFYEFFCAHKHTSGSGGAQDNQRNDLIAFLGAANLNTDEHRLFVAVADGDYYNRAQKERLDKAIDSPRVLSFDAVGLVRCLREMSLS